MNNHEILKQFRFIQRRAPHNRLNKPLAVLLRAHESGFKLIAEGHELINPGDDAD